MKTIGFIDCYLDEWHANNYPAWIEENCAQTGRAFALAYACAEQEKGMTTDEWCRKFGAERCRTIGELVEKSDCVVVLAPDNPECHERLADLPLKSGKPVYVDKTFAPDRAAAARMFDLAERCKTPMWSSSALRFAAELDDCRGTAASAIVIGGNSFSAYLVHPAEMLVTAMGIGAAGVTAVFSGANRMLRIDYRDGRSGGIVHGDDEAVPFQLLLDKDGKSVYRAVRSDFFRAFIDRMLGFFQSGLPPVGRDETLEVMAIVEAAGKAVGSPGRRIAL